MRALSLCFFLVLTLTAAAQRSYGDSILRRLQVPDAPVRLTVVADTVRNRIPFRDVHFVVGPGDTASATLVQAAGAPLRKPLILFQHWGGGNRHYFDAEMEAFAARGFLCLSLDAPWHWPSADSTADPLRAYPDNIQRSVRAITRFLNWTRSQRALIDPDRIYYIGHSYGATLGGLLLPAEPRIRAAVFMAGLPSLSRSMEEDPLGAWKTTKEKKRGIYDTAVYRLSLMEPEHLVRLANARIYYQAAANDQYIVRRHSEEYIRAIGPARTSWYATDHLFKSDSALKDRIAWLLVQDTVTAKAAREGRRLLEQAAAKLGMRNSGPTLRQHWMGELTFYDTAGKATSRWEQQWYLHLPDTVRVRSRHTEAYLPLLPSLELTPAGGVRPRSGRPIDSASFALERRIYYLYWLSLCGPALQLPGTQVHRQRNISFSTESIRVVQRSWPPVVIEIDRKRGLPVALHFEDADTAQRLVLRPGEWIGTPQGMRPRLLRIHRGPGERLLRSIRIDSLTRL
ncbi:alpha/beta hydrolase family protein [Flaviaesturariibacter amylovorans]|uniref:AB hydrolase-1 domain-containing protein n=1 Tax=Flaviaesturariibacter amylovorans TaxID=1084520 RepID=A0ABP8HM28_9BACT